MVQTSFNECQNVDINDIIFYYYIFLCTAFLLPLCFGLLLVLSLYKEDYLQFFNVCPIDYTVVTVSGKVGYP